MWLVEHFVVSFFVALFFVALAYSSIWITGTPMLRGQSMGDGSTTLWRVLQWCCYFSASSGVLLLLHLRLDGIL